MTRTELFKLRAHRTPWVLLVSLTASLLIAPVYYALREPAESAAVIETFGGVFSAMAPLLAAVFGGWMVGHEFRQGTLRRVLGSDARRERLIATKALVGLFALTAGMIVAAGIAVLASLVSVASLDESIVWDGVVRDLLATAFLALVTAAVAFGFSILMRSDTYAMLGAIALITILGPLLTLIPTIGKYTPSALANDVSLWISDADEELGVSIGMAVGGVSSTIAILGAVATVAFKRRDI